MVNTIGRKASNDGGLAGSWRDALVTAVVGIMVVMPMGCTMTMSLGHPELQPAQVQPEVAQKKATPRPDSGPITKATAQKPSVAQVQTDPKRSHYLPDSLLDDSPAQETVRPVRAGRAVNVFGEFVGFAGGKELSNPALQQMTFPDSGYDTEPTVDPETRAIVFSSTRAGDRAQLYIQRPGSAAVIQLTDAASDSAQPCFSHDGSRVAFCSNRGGNWHLYLMDADGRHLTRLTEGPSQDMHPSFNPDGTKLVYCSLTPASEQWQICTIEVGTGLKKTIGVGLFPSWSPQRSVNRIAFQKSRAKGSRWFSLWTMELTDDEPVNVSEIAVSSTAALVGPVWSPDGQRLAFSAISEPGGAQANKPKAEQDIWISEDDGTERVRLTDGAGSNLSPFWATDKRVYFASDRNGQEAIYSLPVRAPAKSAATATGNEPAPVDAAAHGSTTPARASRSRPLMAGPGNQGNTAPTDPSDLEK